MELRTGCDCSAALVGPRDVPPGGSGLVQARCATDANAGPQRYTVTVYSNDPEAPAVVLALTGTVAVTAAAEPARVYLGIVAPGVGAAQQVALRAGSDALRFVGASTDAPQLTVRIGDGPAGGRILVIGTAPAAPTGPFQAVVRVHTTDPTRPFIGVPVAGIIDADAGRADERG